MGVSKTTMPEILHPLMDVPSVRLNRCAVCGRVWPLNQHHVVFRSQGQLFRDGRKLEKPTVTLCGMGNNLFGASADGSTTYWCHGKAHHRMLHFRAVDGHFEYLETREPTNYMDALSMDGWRAL